MPATSSSRQRGGETSEGSSRVPLLDPAVWPRQSKSRLLSGFSRNGSTSVLSAARRTALCWNNKHINTMRELFRRWVCYYITSVQNRPTDRTIDRETVLGSRRNGTARVNSEQWFTSTHSVFRAGSERIHHRTGGNTRAVPTSRDTDPILDSCWTTDPRSNTVLSLLDKKKWNKTRQTNYN